MRIEANATIIIQTVESNLHDEDGDIVLQVEQALNEVSVIEMPESKVKVGIRVHIKKHKKVKN